MTIESEILAVAKERESVTKEIKAGYNGMTLGYKQIRNTAKELLKVIKIILAVERRSCGGKFKTATNSRIITH